MLIQQAILRLLLAEESSSVWMSKSKKARHEPSGLEFGLLVVDSEAS